MSGPIWRTSRFAIDLARPRVMGIVNVTPDSFSEGGAGTVDGAGDRPLRADAGRRRRHPRHRRRIEPSGCAAGQRRGGARSRPPGARSGGRPRRSDLDRHDQGRGHARRARSRRRHRQRHHRAAHAGALELVAAHPGLRRLPDAHARHAAIDAGRGGLRRRRRARSRRSCASGSTRRRRRASTASASSSTRASASARHRNRTSSCWRARKRSSRSAFPFSSAGRASRRSPASPDWRRKRRPAGRRPSRHGSRRRASSPPSSRCSAARASSASTTSPRQSPGWPYGRQRTAPIIAPISPAAGPALHEQNALRHRRHPRHGRHGADHARLHAAARPCRRPGPAPGRTPPDRADRQGHAHLRLHDRVRARGRLRLGRRRRRPDRPVADARASPT